MKVKLEQAGELAYKRPFFCALLLHDYTEDRVPLDQRIKESWSNRGKSFLLFLFKTVLVNQPQATNLPVINNCCGVQGEASAWGSR